MCNGQPIKHVWDTSVGRLKNLVSKWGGEANPVEGQSCGVFEAHGGAAAVEPGIEATWKLLKT